MSDAAYFRAYMAKRRAAFRKVRDAVKFACQRCGTSERQLHFHHPDKTTKRTNPGWLVGNTSMARYLEELAKCEVLCASCHCKETWKTRRPLSPARGDARP